MNYISHNATERKSTFIGLRKSNIDSVEEDMLVKSILSAKKGAVRDQSTSPMSNHFKNSDASTTFSECMSHMSDNEEEVKQAPKAPALPIVLEKGESLLSRRSSTPKYVTDAQFDNLTAKLTDKCDRQRVELKKAEDASMFAQAAIDSCRATLAKIDNFITETPKELQREFNVIAYGPNHTVDERGNVHMVLKDAHSMGGIMALAHQGDLRVQKMLEQEKGKRDLSANSARSERDRRAASRDASLH